MPPFMGTRPLRYPHPYTWSSFAAIVPAPSWMVCPTLFAALPFARPAPYALPPPLDFIVVASHTIEWRTLLLDSMMTDR